MKNIFIKKYWEEDNIIFYIHFQDEYAIRQIECLPNENIYLSTDNPFQNESMLYDQTMNDLDIDASNFITESEFNNLWDNRKL